MTATPRIRRTHAVVLTGWATLLLAACHATGLDPQTDERRVVDFVIHGGSVHDGSGGPARHQDVVVSNGRIIDIGVDASLKYRARQTVDATGMVVAPGFIDAHTHPQTYIKSSDAAVRRNLPWLYQGVTTIMIGVDGGGRPDVAAQRQWFDEHGVGTNLAAYVGFGPVRRAVLQEDDRHPNAAELLAMRKLVAQGMCEGAFGFSTGLFYAPQSFADTDEVIALAREAALRGGLYDTHQRDESSYTVGLLDSTREAIAVGRQAGLPVHIAHIKALGVDVQGQAGELIRIIEQARATGQQVTADQYPWKASGTNLKSALFPLWAQDGGRSALLQRLQDPALRQKIRVQMQDNLRRRGGAQELLLTAAGHPWTGKRLSDVASEWNIDAVDAAIRIVEGDNRPPGVRSAGSVASFNMTDADISQLMQQPWVITGSDGSDGHPRQYATFPKKYRDYVKRDGSLSLAQFIHQSTGLSAQILGLYERGLLRAGYHADIVVFDPDQYAPRADYLHPREPSTGVQSLFVNGKLAIDQGQATDVLAGKFLRHRPTEGTCP